MNKEVNWIDSIGIGLFGFLTVLEISSFFQFIVRHLLIVCGIEPEFILWIPQVLSLVLVIFIPLWILSNINSINHVVSKQNLIRTIFLFFGIIVLQFFYTNNIYDFF